MTEEIMNQPENDGAAGKITDAAYTAEKLIELQTKCDEYLNGWKRALADYQNLKKEVVTERENLGKFALASAAMTFIPIYDNFKMALSQSSSLEALRETPQFKQWLEGIEHIKNQMSEALVSLGVAEIKTVGEKFDSRFHEAVGEEAVESKVAGEIIREVSGGYKIGDRVIRAAKVIISKGQ